MHRQLKSRFILVSMITVGLILTALVSAINFMNYRSMYQRADFVTRLITENGGSFPMDLSQSMTSLGEYGLTPESPYALRYFSVISSPGRDIITTNRDNIAAITGEEIQALVIRVMTGEKDIGNEKHFRFRRTKFSSGTISVFLDMSQSLQTFRSTLNISLRFLLGILVIVYFIIRFLSEKAVKPIVDVLERQKLFINDAGHELKTPLAIISSSADVVELTQGQSQWTESIRKQVDRMNRLIQDMLTLSHYDELHRLTLAPVELSRVLHAVISELDPLAKEKNLQISLDPSEHFTVLGHEDSLSVLFRNLLDNAIRYSDEGGVIMISSRRTSGHVLVEITNPFPDFPEDQLGKIFERFYRADASRSRHTGGTGIGLAMAKTLASSNGGEIKAVKPDDGSITFQVRLRLKK